jgi:hypothetical protein
LLLTVCCSGGQGQSQRLDSGCEASWASDDCPLGQRTGCRLRNSFGFVSPHSSASRRACLHASPYRRHLFFLLPFFLVRPNYLPTQNRSIVKPDDDRFGVRRALRHVAVEDGCCPAMRCQHCTLRARNVHAISHTVGRNFTQAGGGTQHTTPVWHKPRLM